MGLLALAYLALSFLVDDGAGIYPFLVIALGVVFLTEFFARLIDSPSRLMYLRTHWLDLISSIPLIGGLRSLRLLRLLRLGAGLRVLSAAQHVADERAGGSRLWIVLPTLLFTWFAAASAYWVVEHGSNHTVNTFGDSLYWAFITATTLGYGAPPPVTGAGKVLTGLVIFLGVGVVGFTSARITEVWLRDESRNHPRLMLRKLETLEAQMEEVRTLLLAQQATHAPADVSAPAQPSAAAREEPAEAAGHQPSR
jgi:voltage-gated potassium channel